MKLLATAAMAAVIGFGAPAANAETCMIKEQIPVPCHNLAPQGPVYAQPAYRAPVYVQPAYPAPVYRRHHYDYYAGYDYDYYDGFGDYGFHPYYRPYRRYGGYYRRPAISFGFGFGGGYGYGGYWGY